LFAKFGKKNAFKTHFEKRVENRRSSSAKQVLTLKTFTQSWISVHQSTARLLRNILMFSFAKFDKKFASEIVFEKRVVDMLLKWSMGVP